MTGPQRPEHGSKRAVRMVQVKKWLLENRNGASYRGIAKALDLSLPAAQTAVQDIHLFDPMVVAIPAPKNDYRVTANWDERAKNGEANQCLHLATRLERMAIRHFKASDETTSPSERVMLRMQARNFEAEAVSLREIAEVLTTA